MRALVQYPDRGVEIIVEDDRSVTLAVGEGEPKRLSPEEVEALVKQLARSVF